MFEMVYSVLEIDKKQYRLLMGELNILLFIQIFHTIKFLDCSFIIYGYKIGIMKYFFHIINKSK